MLTRILDTSEIDVNDTQIMGELEEDLRRMDKLQYSEGVNACAVKVMPSTRTYSTTLHRFRFEIQYGDLVDGVFKPKSEKENYQTETLPF